MIRFNIFTFWGISFPRHHSQFKYKNDQPNSYFGPKKYTDHLETIVRGLFRTGKKTIFFGPNGHFRTITKSIKMALVAEDVVQAQSLLGEGPNYDRGTDQVLWIDVIGGKCMKFSRFILF
jgi:hypothetical protein